MTTSIRLAAALTVAVGISTASLPAKQVPRFGGAPAFLADLAARRARAMDAFGPDTIAVFWSAPERVYSTDVNYEYRQDSTLLYLTGVDQPETILVLIPGAATQREVLFVRPADPRRELWNGHVMTTDEAAAESGIRTVMTTQGFPGFMTRMLSGGVAGPDTAGPAAEFSSFFAAAQAGRAKVAVLGGGAPAGRGGGAGAGPASPAEAGSPRAFADEWTQKYPGLTSVNATSALTALRAVKTSYEQNVLRRSAELSAEAHLEGMKAARPGRWEYEVEAAIEYWYLKNGMMSWGYPSIVGSGPNATTLHYESSQRQMQDGDLLLVDAAGNFQGLTADITRTYPVNGKFTPEQRAIYELVLAAQEAAITASKIGGRVSDMRQLCRDVFGPGLLKLGLVTDAKNNAQIDMWAPHGPTHGIGIDVHDPLGPTFAVGSAFTVEPGLYIRPDTLDNLPKTPENAALIAKIRPAVEKYKNIGVRIEDSLLFTSSGLVNLSAKAPKQIADLEKIVGTGR